MMTLRQQAYREIDRMSEDGLRFFLDMFGRIGKVQFFSSDELESDAEADVVRLDEGEDDFLKIIDSLTSTDIAGMTKADKKKLFFESGGKLDYDEDAYWAMRERSII